MSPAGSAGPSGSAATSGPAGDAAGLAGVAGGAAWTGGATTGAASTGGATTGAAATGSCPLRGPSQWWAGRSSGVSASGGSVAAGLSVPTGGKWSHRRPCRQAPDPWEFRPARLPRLEAADQGSTPAKDDEHEGHHEGRDHDAARHVPDQGVALYFVGVVVADGAGQGQTVLDDQHLTQQIKRQVHGDLSELGHGPAHIGRGGIESWC